MKIDELARRHGGLSAKVDDLSAKYDDLSAKYDDLATFVRVEQTGLIRELIRAVRDGFDDVNRKIAVLNSRMLTFETWLTRIDERLHDEIANRTR